MQKFKLEYVGPTSGSFTTGKGNNQIEWPEEGSEMVILDPDEAVFNKPRVKELMDMIYASFRVGYAPKEWEELRKELDIK